MKRNYLNLNIVIIILLSIIGIGAINAPSDEHWVTLVGFLVVSIFMTIISGFITSFSFEPILSGIQGFLGNSDVIVTDLVTSVTFALSLFLSMNFFITFTVRQGSKTK